MNPIGDEYPNFASTNRRKAILGGLATALVGATAVTAAELSDTLREGIPQRSPSAIELKWRERCALLAELRDIETARNSAMATFGDECPRIPGILVLSEYYVRSLTTEGGCRMTSDRRFGNVFVLTRNGVFDKGASFLHIFTSRLSDVADMADRYWAEVDALRSRLNLDELDEQLDFATLALDSTDESILETPTSDVEAAAVKLRLIAAISAAEGLCDHYQMRFTRTITELDALLQKQIS